MITSPIRSHYLPRTISYKKLHYLRGGGNLKARLLQLQKQLAPLGLYIKDVSGDGNCFYRAVADQVDGL